MNVRTVRWALSSPFHEILLKHYCESWILARAAERKWREMRRTSHYTILLRFHLITTMKANTCCVILCSHLTHFKRYSRLYQTLTLYIRYDVSLYRLKTNNLTIYSRYDVSLWSLKTNNLQINLFVCASLWECRYIISNDERWYIELLLSGSVQIHNSTWNVVYYRMSNYLLKNYI